MASYSLSPSLVFKGFYDDNTPLVGGKVYTWLAGTSTPVDTYQSNGGAANQNPITLNARGEANIWLDPAISYKIEVQDEDGNIIIPAKDNISVGQSGQLNAVTLDAVSDLRAYAGSATLFYLRGYLEAYDGCGGWVYFDPDSDTEDDGVICFSPNSAPATGRYFRDYSGGPISVRYAGDSGRGSAPVDDQLERCIAYLNAYGGCIYYPVGTSIYHDNHSVPGEVKADDGALFQIQTGNDLTIGGKFTHPATALFSRPTGYLGTLSLANASGTIAFPEWFGAAGDGSTDDLAAINRCFASSCYLYEFPSTNGYLVSAPPSFAGRYEISAFFGVFESGPEYKINPGITTSASFHTDGSVVAAQDIEADQNVTAGANINAGADANITGAVNAATGLIGSLEATTLNATTATIGSVSGDLSVTGDILADGNIETSSAMNATGYIHSDVSVDAPEIIGGERVEAPMMLQVAPSTLLGVPSSGVYGPVITTQSISNADPFDFLGKTLTTADLANVGDSFYFESFGTLTGAVPINVYVRFDGNNYLNFTGGTSSGSWCISGRLTKWISSNWVIRATISIADEAWTETGIFADPSNATPTLNIRVDGAASGNMTQDILLVKLEPEAQ